MILIAYLRKYAAYLGCCLCTTLFPSFYQVLLKYFIISMYLQAELKTV